MKCLYNKSKTRPVSNRIQECSTGLFLLERRFNKKCSKIEKITNKYVLHGICKMYTDLNKILKRVRQIQQMNLSSEYNLYNMKPS